MSATNISNIIDSILKHKTAISVCDDPQFPALALTYQFIHIDDLSQ